MLLNGFYILFNVLVVVGFIIVYVLLIGCYLISSIGGYVNICVVI